MSHHAPYRWSPVVDGMSAGDLPSVEAAMEKLAVVRRLTASAQLRHRHRPSAAENRAALTRALLARADRHTP